jgi:hypothetical protein
MAFVPRHLKFKFNSGTQCSEQTHQGCCSDFHQISFCSACQLCLVAEQTEKSRLLVFVTLGIETMCTHR